MIDRLEHLLEAYDLRPLFLIATASAMIMIPMLMQFSWGKVIAPGDKTCVQVARRITMFLLAASLFWAFSYLQRSGWQPWPPMLGIVIALDLWLGVSVISGYLRERQMKRESQDFNRGYAAVMRIGRSSHR